jgi:hypothetical protein
MLYNIVIRNMRLHILKLICNIRLNICKNVLPVDRCVVCFVFYCRVTWGVVLLCCRGGRGNGMLLSIGKSMIHCLENWIIVIYVTLIHLYLLLSDSNMWYFSKLQKPFFALSYYFDNIFYVSVCMSCIYRTTEKPEGKIPLGRHRRRCEDNIKLV